MSIRELPSGRFVINLAGYYLGTYPSRSSAEVAEKKLVPMFQRAELESEITGVELAIESAMFRVTSKRLKEQLFKLNRQLRDLG